MRLDAGYDSPQIRLPPVAGGKLIPHFHTVVGAGIDLEGPLHPDLALVVIVGQVELHRGRAVPGHIYGALDVPLHGWIVDVPRIPCPALRVVLEREDIGLGRLNAGQVVATSGGCAGHT
ncbi:MAG: hypothetical protein V1694_12245 [Candidatus Eisenbacteria bacterium]